MMRSVSIAAFLIVFGAVCGMFNASGIFDVSLPGSEYTGIDEQTVTELTEGVIYAESNPLGGLSSLITIGSSVFKWILMALVVAPVAMAFGIPAWIAVALSTPIWYIYAVDLLNWWGNRPPN